MLVGACAHSAASSARHEIGAPSPAPPSTRLAGEAPREQLLDAPRGLDLARGHVRQLLQAPAQRVGGKVHVAVGAAVPLGRHLALACRAQHGGDGGVARWPYARVLRGVPGRASGTQTARGGVHRTERRALGLRGRALQRRLKHVVVRMRAQELAKEATGGGDCWWRRHQLASAAKGRRAAV